MPTYNILNDQSAVINVIQADQSFVDAHYPGHYQLVPDPPTPRNPILYNYQFFDRFTDAEMQAIVALQATKPQVAAFLQRLTIFQQIDLSSARVITAINWLVTNGTLTAARAAVILAY